MIVAAEFSGLLTRVICDGLIEQLAYVAGCTGVQVSATAPLNPSVGVTARW